MKCQFNCPNNGGTCGCKIPEVCSLCRQCRLCGGHNQTAIFLGTWAWENGFSISEVEVILGLDPAKGGANIMTIERIEEMQAHMKVNVEPGSIPFEPIRTVCPLCSPMTSMVDNYGQAIYYVYCSFHLKQQHLEKLQEALDNV